MELLVLARTYYWALFTKNRFNPKGLWEIWEQLKFLLVFFVSGLVFGIKCKVVNHKRITHTSAGGRNVLMISYYSPPYKSMYGTQRLQKFIHYLTREKWNITLLTTQPDHSSEQDIESESLPPATEIVRMKKREFCVLSGKTMMVPDDFVPWVLPAVKEARTILRQKRIDLIYASAPPYSNLLVGALCSMRYGIPLVSDFRDPWSKIDGFWRLWHPFLQKLTAVLEARVLQVSSKIIMVVDSKYHELYFANSGAALKNKTVSIKNGFDEEDFNEIRNLVNAERSTQFVASYVGVIYNDETFSSLTKPFHFWLKRYPADAKSVTFEYAGPNSDYFKKHTRLPFRFVDHGYVSHKRAIAIRASSHVQMFSLPSLFSPWVMTGKIYEMIRSDAPILAMTHPEGAVADLIRETKTGFVVGPKDYASAAAILKQCYDKWRHGTANAVSSNRTAVMRYSRESLSKKLAEVFELAIIGV